MAHISTRLAFLAATGFLSACVSFNDIPHDATALVEVSDYGARINVGPTSQGGLSALVGIVLVAGETATETGNISLKDTLRKFRMPDKVKVESVGKRLYEGVSTNGLQLQAGAGSQFGIELGSDEASSFTVTHEVRISQDADAIPYDELTALKADGGKVLYFVESLNVISVTSKVFKKSKGGAGLSGMAFGIAGNTYASQERQETKYLVFADVFNVHAGRVREGSVDTASDHAILRKMLTADEASRPSRGEVISQFKIVSREEARRSLTDVWIGTPEVFGMAPADLYPVKQSKSNSCWLAAGCIMMSWLDQAPVGHEDILSYIGGEKFRRKYESNEGLGEQDKNEFLEALGLVSLPPAGFTMRSLAEDLTKTGPIWFTTSSDINSHAVVVRALLGDEHDLTNSYVVLIDPASGEEEIVPYTDFYRRYDASGGHGLNTVRVVWDTSLDRVRGRLVSGWRKLSATSVR